MASLRILLDMDEVLCDFVGGALTLWGKTQDEVKHCWPVGSWGCVGPLSTALGLPTKMTDEEFWSRIDAAGEGFWENLYPTPFKPYILAMVKSLTPDWHIISSPSRCPTCYTGKVRWLKNQFGPDFDRFALTPHKDIFACRNAVLIDDSDANVQKFRAAGGRGIVFPRHNNSLWRLKHDPVKWVKQALAVHYGQVLDEDLDGTIWSGLDPATRGDCRAAL